MIVSHLLLILHKKYTFIYLCLKPEMWQKVAKFKGAEYFRKALYIWRHDITWQMALANVSLLPVKEMLHVSARWCDVYVYNSFSLTLYVVFLSEIYV